MTQTVAEDESPKVRKQSEEKASLVSWEYLAGYFDASGSLSEHHTNGKGWSYRLRIASYNREQLGEFRKLLGTGTISEEKKPKAAYYRLEVRSLTQVQEILGKLLPYLRAKERLVQDWLQNHSLS